MSFATESTTPLTKDDFMEMPLEQRYAIYMGIGAAAMIDVTQVSDEELRLLGYGIYRDHELKESIGEDDFNDGFYQIRKSVSEQDQAASWEIAQAQHIEDEGLQIPVTAAALVAAFYGGAAGLGAASTIGTTTSAAAGAGAGVGTAQGMVASATWPVIMLGSKITGLAPTAFIAGIAKTGSAVVGVTGTVGLHLSIFDAIVNTEENEQARADVIAERDNYQDVAGGVDEGYSQAEMDARARYMGHQPAGMKTSTPEAGPGGTYGDPAWQVEGPPSEVQVASGPAYERPAGQGQVAPPPGDNYQPTGQDLVGTAPPIGGNIVDPNADNPYVGAEWGIREGYQSHVRKTLGKTELDVWVDPVYRDSDYEALVAGLTESTIDYFQDLMLRAGYMSDTQMTGLMDKKTIDTLGLILYESNANGQSWRNWSTAQAEVGDVLRAEEEEDEKEARLKAIGPFQRKTYLEPDYAALSLTAKDAVERQLGRKINDWEMQLMTGEQEDDYKAQFDATEQVRLSDYNSQVQAVEDDLETGDSFGGGSVEGVDPAARFQTAFEDRFENEIDRKARTVGAEERSSTLMAGLNNAMSAIGGR